MFCITTAFEHRVYIIYLIQNEGIRLTHYAMFEKYTSVNGSNTGNNCQTKLVRKDQIILAADMSFL